ncbi:hypothetical protein SLEP1_g47166 [Rubroshorea leprosula]|uniref:Protein kinase domain-containing protein n=1 Tax=Rubroshorea leprosula TaxID=152421 RepID=A0AAV5LPN4_9ROSI|nr:hypothetical protein SLEP1_g47166 [Rubroshorea leprosula]
MAVEHKVAGVKNQENPERDSNLGENRNEFIVDQPPPRKVLDAQTKEGSSLQWKGMIGNIKKKSVRRFSVIPLITSYEISRKNIRRRLARLQGCEETDSDGMPVIKPSWKHFSYTELATATDNFSSENLLGKGGHAEVYKGRLSDGKVVAVKKIMKNDKEEETRVSDFLS